jgi:Ser/Thr protein kinase RdoA (MazF antagonist)
MIVELAGPVGAGKSSVAKELPDALRARGISVSHLNDIASFGRPRAWLWNLRFAAAHPRLAWAAWRAVAHAPIPWWHRRLIFGLVLGVGGRITYARRLVPPRHVVLVDEGLVHRAVNLFSWYPQPSAEEVRRYVSLVPLPDALVSVQADADAARERVLARGVPKRLVGRSDADVSAFIDRSRSVAATAVTTVRRRPGARVINVHNRASLRRSVSNVARSTSRLVDTSDGGQGDLAFRPRRLMMARPDRVSARLRIRRSGAIPPSQLNGVLDRYGLHPTGRTRTLSAPGARGATVRVPTSDGEVVIKRYKHTVEPSALSIEHAVLLALSEGEVPVPRLRRAIDGDTAVCVNGAYFAVSDAIGGYRHPHELLMAPVDRRHFETLAGRLLARLHADLEEVDVPTSATLGFSGRGGERVRDVDWFTELLADAPAPRRLRAWITATLWQLTETFEGEHLSTTVVHGDYGPYNLLVRAGHVPVVVDFELARRDWRLVDLATGLGWFARRRWSFDLAAARRLLDAYRETSGVLDEELARIPDMAAFLALQRAAVAWSRSQRGEATDWEAEARRRILQAEDLLAGRHPLNAVCRRW